MMKLMVDRVNCDVMVIGIAVVMVVRDWLMIMGYRLITIDVGSGCVVVVVGVVVKMMTFVMILIVDSAVMMTLNVVVVDYYDNGHVHHQ